MKLIDFLTANKLRQSDFARLIGRHKVCVHRMAKKNIMPRNREVLDDVYRATRGQVTANDFYDLPDASGSAPYPEAE